MIFNQELFKRDIVKKRQKDNQSMDDACKKIGVSKATLSRLEKGSTPDIKTFVSICDWLENDSSKYIHKKHIFPEFQNNN